MKIECYLAGKFSVVAQVLPLGCPETGPAKRALLRGIAIAPTAGRGVQPIL